MRVYRYRAIGRNCVGDAFDLLETTGYVQTTTQLRHPQASIIHASVTLIATSYIRHVLYEEIDWNSHWKPIIVFSNKSGIGKTHRAGAGPDKPSQRDLQGNDGCSREGHPEIIGDAFLDRAETMKINILMRRACTVNN